VPIYKASFFFQVRAYGWSESFALQRADASYANAGVNAQQLAIARAACLGQQGALIGFRVSDISIRGDGLAVQTNLPGPTPCDSDNPWSALSVRFRDGTFSAGKTLFMRGIPDDIDVRGGQLQGNNCANFVANFTTWVSMLTNGGPSWKWGWMGRPVPKPVSIPLAGYVIDPGTGVVTITFTAPIFTAPVVNTRQNVFFAGVNAPAKSALAGTQVVYVTSTTTCQLNRPLALFPFNNSGRGTWAVPAFNQFGSAQPQGITERKAGRAFFVERGRQQVRGRG
jgi:hypothetical protein